MEVYVELLQEVEAYLRVERHGENNELLRKNLLMRTSKLLRSQCEKGEKSRVFVAFVYLEWCRVSVCLFFV